MPILLFPPPSSGPGVIIPASALAVDGPGEPGGVSLRERTPQVIVAGAAVTGPRATVARLALEDETLPAGSPPPSRLLLTVLEGTLPSNTATAGFGDRIVQFAPDPGGRFGPHSKTFQDVLSDAGAGSFVLQADDPDQELVEFGHVVRWQLDNRTVFSSIVESRAEQLVAPGEEVDQTVSIDGRGIVAIMEHARVYPCGGLERQPYSDQRVFNWASPSLPTWGSSDEIVGRWTTSVVTPSTARPESWPDNASGWMWDRPTDGNGAPRGTVYFRKRFDTPVVGGRSQKAMVQVWAACGGPQRPGYSTATTSPDEFEVWVDGIKVLDGNAGDTGEAKHADLLLSPGEHLIAVRGINADPLRAGVIVAVMEVDRNGSFIQTLARSDESWLTLGYPPIAPGHSWARVVLTLIREARDRGAIQRVSHIFDELVDENGRQWPVEAEITVPVGNDLLSVLRQGAEAYADFGMGPGAFLLRLWRIDERGATRPIDFEPASNIGSLTVTRTF